ncbi:MAG: hypothetical protein K0R63_963 [Rickettsiales bacterium]|jgi:hypothetical protein|nr:hypothetical protein [Rickettsiales bacterium]
MKDTSPNAQANNVSEASKARYYQPIEHHDEPEVEPFTAQELLGGITMLVAVPIMLGIRAKRGLEDAARHPWKAIKTVVIDDTWKVVKGSASRILRMGLVDMYLALIEGGEGTVEGVMRGVSSMFDRAKNAAKLLGVVFAPLFRGTDYESFGSIPPEQPPMKPIPPEKTSDLIPSIDFNLVPDATPRVKVSKSQMPGQRIA